MTKWIIKPNRSGGYYLARVSIGGIEMYNRGHMLDLEAAKLLAAKLNSELEAAQ
jgi:hypothetical protein